MRRPADKPPVNPDDPLEGFRDPEQPRGFTPSDPRDQEDMNYVRDWLADTNDD
jgi:hypothetical protein